MAFVVGRADVILYGAVDQIAVTAQSGDLILDGVLGVRRRFSIVVLIFSKRLDVLWNSAMTHLSSRPSLFLFIHTSLCRLARKFGVFGYER